MNTRNALIRILAFAGIIASVLLIIGWMLGGDTYMSAADEDDSSKFDTITASSSLEADMDTYIDSSEDEPNPNDFNDSYSDLNR